MSYAHAVEKIRPSRHIRAWKEGQGVLEMTLCLLECCGLQGSISGPRQILGGTGSAAS
jgi:hypothetical protein